MKGDCVDELRCLIGARLATALRVVFGNVEAAFGCLGIVILVYTHWTERRNYVVIGGYGRLMKK
jgi:hypothetical protein